MGASPYLLIYQQELVFPLNLRIPILKFMKGYDEDIDRVYIVIMDLLELDEKRMKTLEYTEKH